LPWLYGVARRVLANERRGDARRQRLTRELQRGVDQAFVDTAQGDAGHLLTALAHLPEPDREALILTAWEGLSSADAATVAGCSGIAIDASCGVIERSN
jgi:RNA polymerase sigma-70 factor, ECF subfamily